MSTDPATRETQLVQTLQSTALRSYLRTGDLSQLPEEEKDKILVKMCAHYGLDPILRPFIMISLRGEGGMKQVWYPTKAATDQMACNKSLTRKITDVGVNDAAGIVTCRCQITDGERIEEAIAAVPVIEYVRENGQVVKRYMTGEGYANAIMKAETKAKRRATMCWFGLAEVDYDTPPHTTANNVQSLQQIAEASEENDTGTEEAEQQAEGDNGAAPKKRRRTRAEIEAAKLAENQTNKTSEEPTKPAEDRLHLADQVANTQSLTPAPAPTHEEKPTPTGMLATDKDGHTVGVDTTSELGQLCAKQVWAEETARKAHGDQLSTYNREIDMHKELLKQNLQTLSIDWTNSEHIKIATKISVAANGRAPIMSGLTVLTVEFGKWIEAEWRKHFLKQASPEIPL